MIISKTPLRISLCGGGTDIDSFYKKHDGMVISCGIDKYVYVIIKERFDNRIVLNYTQHEIVDDVKDIKHDLIREVLKYFGVNKGVEITTLADIPSEGSGLGSSSAVTVGLINAVSHYVNKSLSHKDIAELACWVEIDNLGKPIGKQDQYACTFGGINKYLFKKNYVSKKDYCFSPSEISDISNNLFLHYTGITRDANLILSDQKAKADENYKSLVELYNTTEWLDVKLKNKDFGAIGMAIARNWDIKCNLADGISNKSIDDMIAKAFSGYGFGNKITGAGGGGFLLSYVAPSSQEAFRTAMREYRELKFNIDPYGTRIIFNIA